MHHYLTYYLRLFLQIKKVGNPALYNAINSSMPSRGLKPCVTSFSMQYLTIYGIPLTILDHFVGTMKNITIKHIDAFWISTMVLGQATIIT